LRNEVQWGSKLFEAVSELYIKAYIPARNDELKEINYHYKKKQIENKYTNNESIDMK
jgi:hypothetical protein